MRFLYNILFAIGFTLSSPFYFLKMWRRGNWRRGFGERFGRYSTRTKQAVTNRHVVWLHAVSVGEVNLCVPLVEALEKRLPNVKFIASTTTSTGMGEMQKRLPGHVEKIYYPADWTGWVHRALRTLRPEAIILVEAEIWPNFLWQAARDRVPVFLVNARVSERSFPRYQKAGFLFRPLFGSFRAVGCQNETDARRLRGLGCADGAVRVTGNLKFDAALPKGKATLQVRPLLRQIGVPETARILVAGSTHDGEEALLAGIYGRLKQRFPELFLILVPRHFERTKAVVTDLEKAGVTFFLRSEITEGTRRAAGALDCLVVNTTGELRAFYEEADLVFVGKSLTAEGGQNPIEPCALGKATLFGPNMQNFKSIDTAFTQADAAVQVADAAGLEAALAELLADGKRREELGRNARRVVEQNAGAIERTAELIANGLKETEIYVCKR